MDDYAQLGGDEVFVIQKSGNMLFSLIDRKGGTPQTGVKFTGRVLENVTMNPKVLSSCETTVDVPAWPGTQPVAQLDMYQSSGTWTCTMTNR